MSALLHAPEPLTHKHDTSGFENGVHATLDDGLKHRALASEGFSARSYVVCPLETPRAVVGYFSISTAMEQRSAMPNARLRRGLPEQVPLLLIGRLAVDQRWQGKGIGSMLLFDALVKCQAATQIVGARAVVVHAIDEAAANFYEAHGFLRTLLNESTLLFPLHGAGRDPTA